MSLRERLAKPGYRYLAVLLLLVLVGSAPVWARRLLHRFAYFHVRKIEIRGTRYLQPTDVVARLRVDTMRSVFDEVASLEARLKAHPQIASAIITRRAPGTLIVSVVEQEPVALVPSNDGLVPYDSAGRALPIDPSRTTMDLPILSTPDAETLHLLGAIMHRVPRIFDRISQAERAGPNDVIFVLEPALRIRIPLGVAPNRLQDIFPVESDLARRHEQPVELDLRYRDQVIARL